MNWEKLGRIFIPNSDGKLLNSHASNPIALHLEGDIFRIYYNGRDKLNKSSISFFDFNISNLQIEANERSIVTTFGADNSFSSNGISNGCLIKTSEGWMILVMAWQIRGNNHWRGDIGSVLLDSSLSKGKIKEDPFLGIDDKFDLTSLSYPWVIFEDSLYKMWYGSTISWTSENGEMIHTLNYAESKDLLNWTRFGPVIPYEIGEAQAFSRPTILKLTDGYHMWYSYRSGNGTPYRIGYSFSANGRNWISKNMFSGIDVSDSGWDSQMVCYPFVFQHLGINYMLYNGNNHGQTGIGIAKLIE